MTKRFKLFVGKNYGVQKVDGEVIFDSIISMAEADVLVDWLNDITNRNKELKHENEQLKHQNELLSDELEQCRAVIDKRWSEYLKRSYKND